MIVATRIPEFYRVLIAAFAILLLELAPTSAQAPQPEQPPAPQPSITITPRAYVQLDARTYPDWAIATGTGRLNHDTLEVRRARLGVDGRLWRLAYEVTVDPQDNDGVFVKDAYAQIRFNRAVRLRAGQFKVPGTREYQTSARALDFLERSALAESLAAGRDIGAMVTADIGRRLEVRAGIFAGDGNGRESRAKETVAGRVTWTPLRTLEVAGTFSTGRIVAVDSESANGLEGRSPSGYRFFERVYAHGRRARLGADAEWNRGPWRVTAQALWTRDDRNEQGLDLEDLPAVRGTGWSVEARRRFGRQGGARRSRLREWDLAIRYDELSFDDVAAETGRDSVRPRATDVRARAAQTLGTSASWQPTNWTKVIGNASIERYAEPLSAPAPGRSGPYWLLGARLQFELP